MKLAFINKDGVLELRWMWLPTFISQNYGLMKELQQAWDRSPLKRDGVHPDAAEEVAHAFSIQWLSTKLGIQGLGEYLDAIRNVKET